MRRRDPPAALAGIATIQRRAVLTGGLLAVVPVAVRAEPTIRIGVLGPDEQPRFGELVAGLHQGLLAQGYAAHRIEFVESPVTRGDAAGIEAAARRLRGENVAAIFAVGSEVTQLARRAVPDVPIVFITPGDPVAAGLVASLARPGANLTGVTFEFPELSGKRLELTRDIVGSQHRIIVVADPLDPSPRQALEVVRQAAADLGTTVLEQPVRTGDDIAGVIAALPGSAAMLVIPGGAPTAYQAGLMQAAHAAGVVTVFAGRTASSRDAVMTYGARDSDVARDAARLIDRIVKGTPAGDIPVERPTRFELVINLKTARAIGVIIPPALLARADEVIE